MTRFFFSPHTIQSFKQVQSLLDRLQPDAASQAMLAPGSAPPQRGVIVFTGSFNPPTIAHLALLKQAQQFARVHQPMSLYAALSKLTVDKETVERPLLADRILLLSKLLRHRLPRAGILLFNRGLYVEQAEALRSSFPRVRRIFFLMGFDKIVQIFDPRYYTDRDAALEALFSLAELLVAPRGEAGSNDLSALLQQPQNQRFARYVHALPFYPMYRNISSTAIRYHADEHRYDVPQEVRKFMQETRAYAPPLRLSDGTEFDYYGERIKQLLSLTGGSGR